METPIPARPRPANGKDKELVRRVALEEDLHVTEDEPTEESEGLFGTLRPFTAESCWSHTNSLSSPSVGPSSTSLVPA